MLCRAQEVMGVGIVFILHDIVLVFAFCDCVVVMKDGLVVEELLVWHICEEAKNFYMCGLIVCLFDMCIDWT